MILKGEILAALLESAEESADPFIIRPEPDGDALRRSGSASVDLRLGTWFLRLRQSRNPILDVTEKATTAKQAETKLQHVPFGNEFILHPGAFVLGATLEWIRLPRDLAGYVIGRSSWGRRGLIIATAIGVHPGFTGCLTLELSNVGEIPIAIRPGLAISQLYVHRVERGRSDAVDQTAFVGRRRPVLGQIRPDEVARKLANPSKDQ